MTSKFVVLEEQDGKLILLDPRSGRIRALLILYGLTFLIGSIGFLFLIGSEWKHSLAASLIGITAAIAFGIAFFRFIDDSTRSEKLFVNRQRLDIIQSSLFRVKRQSFLITGISDFKFLGKERYEPHPLKGETFDYLGFQTEQKVIEELHGDGQASFVYQGRRIRFGKSLASWEFSELEVLLYEITGNDFRYTDRIEQENFPAQ